MAAPLGLLLVGVREPSFLNEAALFVAWHLGVGAALSAAWPWYPRTRWLGWSLRGLLALAFALLSWIAMLVVVFTVLMKNSGHVL